MKKLNEFATKHPKMTKAAKTTALLGAGAAIGIGVYLGYKHFVADDGGCAAPATTLDAPTDASKDLYAPCAF